MIVASNGQWYFGWGGSWLMLLAGWMVFVIGTGFNIVRGKALQPTQFLCVPRFFSAGHHRCNLLAWSAMLPLNRQKKTTVYIETVVSTAVCFASAPLKLYICDLQCKDVICPKMFRLIVGGVAGLDWSSPCHYFFWDFEFGIKTWKNKCR